MADLIRRRTELSGNLVAFCRFLRKHGFSIGPSEESDALLALELLDPFADPDAFQQSLRAVLARNLRDYRRFDELFAQYFAELRRAVDSKRKEKASEGTSRPKAPKPPTIQSLKDWLHGNRQTDQEEMASYSPGEVLSRQDFSRVAREDQEALLRIIRRLARSMALRVSRRRRRSNRRVALDLRSTLRHNMRRGGELLELRWHAPRRRRQRIVLLCDVSRSMDLYSRFLIQFAYTFQQAYQYIEAFAFSTSLRRITAPLKHRDFDRAMQELAEAVPGWSGGTRIGASLDEFVRTYGSRLLNRQTLVILLSDGIDTGDTALLADSMRLIHKRAGKVVWLNPLAGRPGYEPRVKGMQAALPYIDVFASAHNVHSLELAARQF